MHDLPFAHFLFNILSTGRPGSIYIAEKLQHASIEARSSMLKVTRSNNTNFRQNLTTSCGNEFSESIEARSSMLLPPGACYE